MPQQKEGRMRGFQLWINLPAAEKMKPAGYRDIPAAEIPVVTLAGGVIVKLIAGELRDGERLVAGPIAGLSTEPLYMDVAIPAGARFVQALPPDHSAFVYVFEGRVTIGGMAVDKGHGAVLVDGDACLVDGAEGGGRLLLLAGRPLREPVVQYGPFVMNTAAEIQRALLDYQSGRLT
jgi:redox-sensitive bicupin YhaK (pirin superfamily)